MKIKDKTIIITGASDGIGKVAAKQLRDLGAKIVIIGRSPEKTKAVAEEIGTDYYFADFSKLREVRELASKLRSNYPKIDVLVNNAGGIFGKRQLTEDGFEKTMQVNHLSHFLLTTLLMDTLLSSNATIINTSSIANRALSNFDINDVNMKNNYTPNSAYGNAKLENILFTKELHRRFGDAGISAVAFHPGNVTTNFASGSTSFLKYIYQTPLKHLFGLISAENGADTMVWLASTSPDMDWQPGEYYVKRKISQVHELGYDKGTAYSLWKQSEAMITANEVSRQAGNRR